MNTRVRLMIVTGTASLVAAVLLWLGADVATDCSERVIAGESEHVLLRGGHSEPGATEQPRTEHHVRAGSVSTASIIVRGAATYAGSATVPGTFGLVIVATNGWSGEAKGRNGEFSVAVPGEGTYAISDVTADGVPCRCEPTEVWIGAKGTRQVGLSLIQPATLKLVDAETGRRIVDAEAFRYQRGVATPSFVTPYQVPSSSALLSGAVRASRVGIMHLYRAGAWHITAPGYAWTSVLVECAAAPRIIELQRSGGLRIVVDSWEDLDKPSLSVLYEDGFRYGLPAPDAEGRCLLRGLLPGQYTLLVRRGRWELRGEIYGEAQVLIVAGSVADAVIPTRRESESGRMVVQGTVTCGSGCVADELFLCLEGMDLVNAGESADVYLDDVAAGQAAAFSTKPILPGRYRLYVMPFNWTATLTVRRADPRVDVVLPSSIAVVVRLKDGADSKLIETAQVDWRSASSADLLADAMSEEATYEPERDGFVLRCMPSVVRLNILADGYLRVIGHTIRVSGASHGHTIQLRRAAQVTVRVTLDKKPIHTTVVLGSSAGGQTQRTRKGNARFPNLPAGQYVLSIYDVAGCVSPPPLTIVARAGETSTFVIELERAR